MKKLRTQFTDSFQELRSMKTMVAASMLLAITVVLGFYRLQLTDFLRLGFDFLPKELTAMLFGPGVGCVVAALADIISFIIKPVGAFFPGLTISAMLASVIYGMFLYRKPLSLKRIIMANTTVTILINLFLNTYWMTILYGDTYAALFPARAVKQLIMLPIEIVLYYSVAKILSRARVFSEVGSAARS